MLSLRKRALIGGALTAVIVLAVGTYLLYSLMGTIALSRFDNTLKDRHTQLTIALNDAEGDPVRLSENIFDPAFRTPFSGRYWQIIAPDGRVFTSDSMLSERLDVPSGIVSGALFRDAIEMRSEPVRTVHQSVRLSDGSTWGITVAEARESLTIERAVTRRSLLLAFALLALLVFTGAIAQTTAIMRPIDRLRKDVAGRWELEEGLNPDEYPEEVAPLVTDINDLLERNREIIGGARRQAADLAHALKTPSAILRNELTALAEQGLPVTASVDALDRVDAQLGRSLARMRAANSGASAKASTSLSASISRFNRLFGSMAARDGKALETVCDKGFVVRIDAQDIEEVMGNLLDNALKWCNATVRMTLEPVKGGIMLSIEDDGPGIPEDDRREALSSGGRLDSSKPGTGLGLAIALDLLNAYGAELRLSTSTGLGGLSAEVFIPNKLIRNQIDTPITLGAFQLAAAT